MKPINHIEEARRLGQIAKDKAVDPTELIHGTADAAKRATGEAIRLRRALEEGGTYETQ